MKINKYAQFTSLFLGKKSKKIIRYFWFFLIIFGISTYFIYPEFFTQESIQNFLEKQGSYLLLFYILISFIRGLFLIPSTPFVLAGALLFPQNLILVFWISMIGIVGSGFLIYWTSNFLEMRQVFQKIDSKKMISLESKMKKHGFWVTLIWSFLPIVPTDLISYVAGITKFDIRKFIIALFLGESIIVVFYLFIGKFLNHRLF